MHLEAELEKEYLELTSDSNPGKAVVNAMARAGLCPPGQDLRDWLARKEPSDPLYHLIASWNQKIFMRIQELREMREVYKVNPTAKLDAMTGEEFEDHLEKLLLAYGADEVERVGATGDQGVDIIAVINGCRIAIQAKRYSSPVGNEAVQEVFAGKRHYRCRVAWVITTATFTKSAKELAESTGVRLIDRNSLLNFESIVRSAT